MSLKTRLLTDLWGDRAPCAPPSFTAGTKSTITASATVAPPTIASIMRAWDESILLSNRLAWGGGLGCFGGLTIEGSDGVPTGYYMLREPGGHVRIGPYPLCDLARLCRAGDIIILNQETIAQLLERSLPQEPG